MNKRSGGVTAALAVLSLAFPGSLFAGDVLVYGPSVFGEVGNEVEIARQAGHTVTIAKASTWSGMTTADFAVFDAILFGDNNCQTNLAVLDAANANKTVWSRRSSEISRYSAPTRRNTCLWARRAT